MNTAARLLAVTLLTLGIVMLVRGARQQAKSAATDDYRLLRAAYGSVLSACRSFGIAAALLAFLQ